MDFIRFASSASDLDLLTRAVGSSRSRSAEAIAAGLLERFGDLTLLCDAPVAALATEPGLGPKRAAQLHAALTAGRRSTQRPPRSPRHSVQGPEAAAEILTAGLRGLVHEELHALYLDRGGAPLTLRVLARGSAHATAVNAAHIFRPAVQCGAHHVVLAHNHPSGDPQPSMQDITSTYRMVDAAQVIGIAIVDHLVVTDAAWTSMALEGLILPPPSWLGAELDDLARVSGPLVGDP